MIKWNIEKIKMYVKEHTETTLLSNEYKGQNELLEFKCKCGNEFKRTWRIFYRGCYECKTCAWKRVNESKTYTIEYIRNFVKENSTATLLSNEYITCKIKLKFKCECGEEFETTFDSFKNANKRRCTGCNIHESIECRGGLKIPKAQPKSNEKFLKQLYDRRGDEFTPLEKYTNAKVPIKVRHNRCGYIWNVSPDHLINRKDNCPSCMYAGNNSRGSKNVEIYLKKKKYTYVREKKFKGLKGISGQNNLRFDFYLPLMNICIEFDGKQHFQPIKMFGGEKAFKLQNENDNIKNEFCKRNNIELIRIPYYEADNIPKFLDKAIMSQAIESK